MATNSDNGDPPVHQTPLSYPVLLTFSCYCSREKEKPQYITHKFEQTSAIYCICTLLYCTVLYRWRVWPCWAETDKRPDDVLPEAGAPRGEWVWRHPAEVWTDSPTDHERGGLRGGSGVLMDLHSIFSGREEPNSDDQRLVESGECHPSYHQYTIRYTHYREYSVLNILIPLLSNLLFFTGVDRQQLEEGVQIERFFSQAKHDLNVKWTV